MSGALADHPAGTPPRRTRDSLAVVAIAFLARIAVVAWAAPRFPPAADGTFYQRIAERIARGLGYTWLWPDGAVTYAAHYPVGYPAAAGAIYALAGPHPAAAMTLNAALGALAAFALHRLAVRAELTRSAALAAGLLVAVHPGLVAYTPALMTEGVTAALVACAAATAAWARDRIGRRAWLGPLALGLVLGVATLVRPQCLALAPALALLAAFPASERDREPRSRSHMTRNALAGALLATATALLVCAPWTARNCVHMKRCALVSVNGGWNLLIGADAESTGAWSPINVPAPCLHVYDEAEKDACFEREARRYIASHPATWLALVPRKLAATFDYAGAAGWYLHESNAAAFDERAKVRLGIAETAFERFVLLAALLAVARRPTAADGAEAAESPSLFGARAVVALVGAASVFTVHAWIGYVAFGIAALLRGRALLRGPMLVSSAAIAVLLTAFIHAVFFGAGRYSLVVFPLLCGVAPLAFAGARTPCSHRRARATLRK